MSAASPYRIAGERLVHHESIIERRPVVVAAPESEDDLAVACAYPAESEAEPELRFRDVIVPVAMGSGLGVLLVVAVLVFGPK